MSNCVSVKARLSSIMEALTSAAVAEINKLFQDSSAVLLLEISRSRRENQALRKRLELFEGESGGLPGSAGAAGSAGSGCGDGVRGTAGGAEDSLCRAAEDWPADVEGGPSLIKVESCEEVWSGSETHTQLDPAPEGAGDVGLGHWAISPTKAPPAGGTGELSEDEEWGGDTAGSRCSDTTQRLTLPPPSLPPWSMSIEGGAQLGPPTLAAAANKPPAWGQEAGPGAEAGLRAAFSEGAGQQRAPRPAALSCAECGKTFARRYYLRVHQRYHTGEQLLRCPQCDMAFACAHHLRQHQKCHSGEKPFRCATCGKDFSRKYNLKEHQKIHTGERPHACPACGKSFKQLSTLRTHQRSHSGDTFSCACGKSFNRKYVLKVHQRIHTGERPYGCERCGKSFTQPCVLRSHMRTHCSSGGGV